MTPNTVHNLQNCGLASAGAVVEQVDHTAVNAHKLKKGRTKGGRHSERMRLKAGHIVHIDDALPLLQVTHWVQVWGHLRRSP